VGFFKKRDGPEDFYDVATKTLGTKAMAANIQMVSAAERRWRSEFDAYGLPAAEYVRAWLTPPLIDPLLTAWAEHMAFVEEHDHIRMQMLRAKMLERTHGMPLSPTVPPTFVVTAWKLARCPDADAFLSNDDLWLGGGPLGDATSAPQRPRGQRPE
jgi:hypothetical protein